MIDLDGLKAINDSLGHLRGDDVLRAVGRVINGSIRTVDSAYRYGGDEFLILLPETEFIGAYVVAEKIREGVEEIGESLATEVASTSVSIGLVSHPEDGATPEDLMVAADRAMYQAKSLGKNQISGNPRPRRLVYSPEPELGAACEPGNASPNLVRADRPLLHQLNGRYSASSPSRLPLADPHGSRHRRACAADHSGGAPGGARAGGGHGRRQRPRSHRRGRGRPQRGAPPDRRGPPQHGPGPPDPARHGCLPLADASQRPAQLVDRGGLSAP